MDAIIAAASMAARSKRLDKTIGTLVKCAISIRTRIRSPKSAFHNSSAHHDIRRRRRVTGMHSAQPFVMAVAPALALQWTYSKATVSTMGTHRVDP
jgi:hypothetical protein